MGGARSKRNAFERDLTYRGGMAGPTPLEPRAEALALLERLPAADAARQTLSAPVRAWIGEGDPSGMLPWAALA